MRLGYLLVFLSGFLLLSCNKPDDGSDEMAYIWFEVSGKVVDMAGNPIKGISVMAESAETCITDASGRFTVNGGGKPAKSAPIQFLDREDDGKNYVSKTVSVDLVKYKDGHGWNKGYYRNRDEVIVALVEDAVITPSTSGLGTGQGEEQ